MSVAGRTRPSDDRGRMIALTLLSGHGRMSSWGRRSAKSGCEQPQQPTALFDRRVGTGEQRLRHTVPIVLTLTADPLGGGFVENLARSGGNAIAEDADV
jgi:hypothetical protein